MLIKYIGKECDDFVREKIYPVLCIEFTLTLKEIKYRILSEDYQLSIIENSNNFVVIDHSVNQYWSFFQYENGYCELTPCEWAEDGFWEKLYDGNKEAFEIYRNVAIKMYKELKSRF